MPVNQTEETKQCPHCNGLILLEAIKCKHCRRFLATEGSGRPIAPSNAEWAAGPITETRKREHQTRSRFSAAGQAATPSKGRRSRRAYAIGLAALATLLVITLAVSAFLSHRTHKADQTAQADLRSAAADASTVYFYSDLLRPQSRSFSRADASGLTELRRTPSIIVIEGESPSVMFVNGETPSVADPVTVSVAAASDTWAAARLSASGKCFLIRTDDTTRTTYGMTSTASCTGATALRLATSGSWP